MELFRARTGPASRAGRRSARLGPGAGGGGQGLVAVVVVGGDRTEAGPDSRSDRRDRQARRVPKTGSETARLSESQRQARRRATSQRMSTSGGRTVR